MLVNLILICYLGYCGILHNTLQDVIYQLELQKSEYIIYEVLSTF